MMLLVVPLVLAAQSGIVLGVGTRGSVLQLSEVGKQGSGLPKDTFVVALTDVMSPHGMQKSGAEALRFALDATLGEMVSIEPRPASDELKSRAEEEGITRFGRVRVGKKWLHEELLKAGWAWVLPAARSDAALVKLETEAREAKRGLWAWADAMEPWLWRELILLRDVETKVFHAGWECPHVKETQCRKCGGGRYYSLEDATKEGFTPHEVCVTPELLRVVKDSGFTMRAPPMTEEAPLLPPSERRECKADADCALTPNTPCTCLGCGSTWKQAARKEIAARMAKNFAQVNCGGVGCPACAGREIGSRAICRQNQCAPAP
ncbi:MAG: thermonuclease family protein [Archangium sp.]